MEKIFKLKDDVKGLAWEVSSPKAIVVISHGMAEHASRYGRFANELNKHNYSVYAIDQIGHGIPPVHKKGHFEPGDFEKCADNLHTLIEDLHAKYSVKIFLFGHSMGSFIAQRYIGKYGNSIAGCVLSGSNGPSSIIKVGKMAANFFDAFNKADKPSKVMNSMSFGSYNKAFKPTRTDFDWLSRDEKEVDKYIADPDCGYLCTFGFYKEFMGGLNFIYTEENVNGVPKDLPILVMSGSADPVGGEVGTTNLVNMYKEHNIKNIKHTLYPEGRHEMLNEVNRDEVMADIIAYLDEHI